MKVVVHYQDQAVEIDLPDANLVDHWAPKEGIETRDLRESVRQSLDSAIDYPALRQTVVPGDRVALAVGHDLPEVVPIVSEILEILAEAEVTSDLVRIVGTPRLTEPIANELGKLADFHRHDPNNRDQLAYLASTKGGRRVYLNRALVDADFVVTLGSLGFDSRVGYGGPWSTLFPGLSDAATQSAFQTRFDGSGTVGDSSKFLLEESWEVSWLLGSQFQIAVSPGLRGVRTLLTGLGTKFQDRVVAEINKSWRFQASERAEVVVAGIGSAERSTGIDEVAVGLANASRLVQRGGKIILLSTAEGAFGRSVSALIEAERARSRTSPLRGLEAEPDFATATRIAKGVAWADVYLLSRFNSDDVEGLGILPLEKPKEGSRLAALSRSCLVISQAERVVVDLAEGAE